MTLLLTISKVGVNSESMENDKVDGLGEEGKAKEEGLSPSLLHMAIGRDGEGFNLSLDFKGSERCVLEQVSVEDCGDVWADELERNSGLEELCISILGERLFKGLLLLFMNISVSSAGGELPLPGSHCCSVPAAPICDKGSYPVSLSRCLSPTDFCLSVSVSSSSTPYNLSAVIWCCLVEPTRGTVSITNPCPPDKSKDLGLSVFGSAGQSWVSLGLEATLVPQSGIKTHEPKHLGQSKVRYSSMFEMTFRHLLRHIPMSFVHLYFLKKERSIFEIQTQSVKIWIKKHTKICLVHQLLNVCLFNNHTLEVLYEVVFFSHPHQFIMLQCIKFNPCIQGKIVQKCTG